MEATSVYFKGNLCFKDYWVGFEKVKPINVIIGRNNSGKSQLLDLVKVLCGDALRTANWDVRCSGALDELSLKAWFRQGVSGGELEGYHWDDHGKHLVDSRISWETSAGSEVAKILEVDESFRHGQLGSRKEAERKYVVSRLLINSTHILSGKGFRRPRADRDIGLEPEKLQLNLDENGEGATNLIRRFILSSNEDLPREVIQSDLLQALNLVFETDGNFLEIQVQNHDDQSPERPQSAWEVYLSEQSEGLIPLSMSGSGLKTVILVFLNLLVVPKVEKKDVGNYVFAFEELENNLHPALLRRLHLYLEKFALKHECVIFLTTHSSTSLDIFGISENAQIIRVTHNGESAQTSLVSARFDQLRVVAALGAKPSDLLQANGIVWVEGPSDRIYLNKWIELCSDGELVEGRDYQCAFYGGALLARTQFTHEDQVTTADLANLLRVNPNIIVVCDSDRRMKGAHVKDRVKRIRPEIANIPSAHIWVTSTREIETYIPGEVLQRSYGVAHAPDPEPYQHFFPRKGSHTKSYVAANLGRKTLSKVELALLSAHHMTEANMKGRFDWVKQMAKVVKQIREWNM